MKTNTNNIHVKNLINDLKEKGISFYFDNETTIIKNLKNQYVEKRLENIVFEKDGIKHKICESLFFRDGGQCKYLDTCLLPGKLKKTVLITLI